MGTRGPKPGFKAVKAAQAAAALASAGALVESGAPAAVASAEPARTAPTAADLEFDSWLLPASEPKPPAIEAPPPARPAMYWENPAHLEGDALRALGHRRGLALSAMASMPDEKIRMELKYIAYHQAREADAEYAGA